MKYKIWIMFLFSLILLSSCSPQYMESEKQNSDTVFSPEEENPNLSENIVEQPHADGIPDSYSGMDAEEYVQKNGIYILNNFPLNYSLIQISEVSGEKSVHFYLGDLDTVENISDSQNRMILSYTDLSPWDLDVHKYI